MIILEKSKPKERTVYLFNDLIVMTKPKKNETCKDRFRYQLPLGDAKIIDIADTDTTKNAFEVCPKDSCDKKKTCIMVLPTDEDKKSWVREIKGLVKEFQRLQYGNQSGKF